MADRVDYDEFGLFHENAAEYGLPYAGRRRSGASSRRWRPAGG